MIAAVAPIIPIPPVRMEFPVICHTYTTIAASRIRIPTSPLTDEAGSRDRIPSHKYKTRRMPNVLINAMIWLYVREDRNIPMAAYTHPTRKKIPMEI